MQFLRIFVDKLIVKIKMYVKFSVCVQEDVIKFNAMDAKQNNFYVPVYLIGASEVKLLQQNFAIISNMWRSLFNVLQVMCISIELNF